jgi:hypothetical protein
MVAFAIKAPLFPFHGWLPDTYREAPPEVTAVLSGVIAKAGLYGMLRIAIPLFPDPTAYYRTAILALAAATLVYGSHFAEDFEDAAAYGWSVGASRFDWPTLRDNKTREIERLRFQAKPGAHGQESLFVETRRRNCRQAAHVGLAQRPADLLGDVKQRAHERIDRPAFVAVPNRWLEPAILQRGHLPSAPADLLLPL